MNKSIPWQKSNLSFSGRTMEPFWSIWSPSTSCIYNSQTIKSAKKHPRKRSKRLKKIPLEQSSAYGYRYGLEQSDYAVAVCNQPTNSKVSIAM